MSLKSRLIWTVVCINGIGLLANGELRNQYYEQFSYLFPVNNKQVQDLAQISRMVISLLMSLSILNLLSGYLFKVLSLISFVIYTVVIHQSIIISVRINEVSDLYSLVLSVVVMFFGMDSIVNQIIREDNQRQIQMRKEWAESRSKQTTRKQQKCENKTQSKISNKQTKKDSSEVKNKQKLESKGQKGQNSNVKNSKKQEKSNKHLQNQQNERQF